MPLGRDRFPGGRVTTAGDLPASRQAREALAKKNLLVLKGGLAAGFGWIRIIEAAFLLPLYYNHYRQPNSRRFSGNFPREGKLTGP